MGGEQALRSLRMAYPRGCRQNGLAAVRGYNLDFLDLSSNNIRKFELVLLRKNLKINLSLNEELKFNLAGFKFIKYAKDISINKCKEIIQFSLNNIVCTSPNNKLQCQLESFMVCFF